MRISLRRRSGFALALLTLFFLLHSVSAQEASAQELSEEATQDYNSAVGLHKGEAYDLAAEEWLRFVQQHPADPRIARAQHYLGVCYVKQNKPEEAVKTFAKVAKDYPEFDLLAETLLNLGLTQYNLAYAGKTAMYDAAAKTFETLTTKFPKGKNIPEAIFYHGECLYNRGKKKEAVEKYSEVVSKHPNHAVVARATLALGVAQADLGQHDAALATYDDFLKKSPNDPLAAEATMWRGESLHALKRYDEAAKAYASSAAAAGFAMADYATVRQADSLSAKREFAEAAAVYASVPAKFPKSQYVGLCNLEAGKKYYAAGDFAAARPFLDKVAAGGGKSSAEAAHWIARGLLKQKEPVEAISVVQKALRQAPDGPDRVALLMDQADATYEIPASRAEAGTLYAAVAQQYPGDPSAPQALYMAAFTAMNQGDYAAVLPLADNFMAAYPGNALAVGVGHVKAESLLLSNKFAEAEQLYGQLLKQYASDRDAEIWKVHLGTAIYLQKKYADAIKALKPIVAEVKSPDLVAEAWYRIGRSEAALKQYDNAIASLEASLAAQPKWKLTDDARLVLAYAYQQTKQLDKAAEQAAKVVADFPNSKLLDMAHYRLGECARLTGDLDTAVAQYERVLKDWPQSVLTRQTLYGLGWAKLGKPDHAGAESAFTSLIDKFPEDTLVARAKYGRGMARRELKKFKPAVEDVQAFLATNPPAADRSRARHVLGLCQKGLNQHDQAAATFAKLFEDDPQYADADNALFEWGWALKSSKNEEEAAATFAKLAKEHPDSPLAADSQYLVGDFAYEQKNYKKAATAYYAAMNKAGEGKLGEEAAYKLGLAYYLMEDFKSAAQTFKFQLASWPEGSLSGDGMFMQAESLFRQGMFDEALPLYGQVKNPSSQDVEVLTLLHAGHCAGTLKQWAESLETLTQCVEQFPDSRYHTQALYEQGWAQQNLGKHAQAIAIYEQVIAKSRQDTKLDQEPAAKAQLMIGEVQFEQKKHADAVKSFFRVIYNYGYPKWRAQAMFEAARCFEVMGKTPQAVTQYESLIKEYPENERVSQAKSRIEALKKN